MIFCHLSYRSLSAHFAPKRHLIYNMSLFAELPKVERSVEPILSKNVRTGDFESPLMKVHSGELFEVSRLRPAAAAGATLMFSALTSIFLKTDF